MRYVFEQTQRAFYVHAKTVQRNHENPYGLS
jgi:hypothetical protein